MSPPLSEAGQAALQIARSHGWKVFPCDPRLDLPGEKRCKRPLIKNGFHGASRDPRQIDEWWRQWPDAMIGVPAGQETSVWILDPDLDAAKGFDGPADLAQLAAKHGPLPSTVEALTPRGGHHLYFEWAEGITNGQGQLPASINVRGAGGFFVCPPSRRADGAQYRWVNPPGFFEPVPAPDWLLQIIGSKPQAKAQSSRFSEAFTQRRKAGNGASPYAEAALRNECDAVARQSEPGRNDRLNRAAFSLGQLVGSGELDETRVIFDLLAAAGRCGLIEDDGEPQCRATISSGLESGKLNPRVIPERPRAAADATSEEWGATVGVTLADFYAYMPAASQFIFAPSREMWPAISVNARVPPPTATIDAEGKSKPVPASAWLAKHRAVEQMTWAPGQSPLIKDRLISEGGWLDRPGCSVFNLYKPPTIIRHHGDAAPWLDHLHKVFPDDAGHIGKWLAHRVQRPQEKINHALVLGGLQGIGKDTILEPVKQAIGPWNFAEVSPQHMLGRFNGFLKSVILRVSEARDLGDTDRFAFYDHLKAFTAAPPDVLRVDEKFLREYAVLNVCGIIITSNHKADGIYLPADDRRHYVGWSDLGKDDFTPAYWTGLYAWFADGGNAIVADHLARLDLSGFDAKAPPPKTPAFWEIVNSSRAPENSELADALDKLGRPAAVTLLTVKTVCDESFVDWLNDRRNGRKIPHRMEECGYLPVRNPDADDGLWRVRNRRQAVYAKRELSPAQRESEAASLAKV